MRQPLISVITVCLNSENTIAKTIESVLAQTYDHIEYLIVDGMSSDSTMKIVTGYNEQFKMKGVDYRWISDQDKGIYDAMNKGIKLAGGELIGIINSDDYFEVEACRHVAESYSMHPAGDIFYGFMRVLLEGKELLIHRYNFDNFLLNLKSGVYTSAQHSSCFVKKGLYEDVGNFDLSFRIAADYDFLLRAAINKNKFIAIDHLLANFSRGGANDQMTEYERLEQRYRIWFKNGLINERDYTKLKKQSKYTLLKQLKKSIVKKIFSFH